MKVTCHYREWNHGSSAKPVPSKLSKLMTSYFIRPPSSRLRLDLPSGIFPSDFPVIFCIPSHPSNFRIWFQSHVTSSFMNCHIAHKMAAFRNLHNSSTKFQHYYTAGLQTHLLSKCGAHNICFPSHFRRNMTSVVAGLLRIGQVFLSPVKMRNGGLRQITVAWAIWPRPTSNPNTVCSSYVYFCTDYLITFKNVDYDWRCIDKWMWRKSTAG